MLLTRRSEGRLYPIQVDRQSINKFSPSVALMGVRTTLNVWHARLGHTSSHITKNVVHTFDLPVSSSSNLNSICQFCQIGKSKQFPFSDSSRATLSPLDLIHSNIWVSPIVSSEVHRYYVLFIGDYSSFT